jgi:hypothetical protein
VQALPTTLAESTLLTGYVNACAVPYVFQVNTPVCSSPPATPIHTDQGDFYLQDEEARGKGIFTVEVVNGDD